MITLSPNEHYPLDDLGSDFPSSFVETGDEDIRGIYVVISDPCEFHEKRLGRELTPDDMNIAQKRVREALSNRYDAHDIGVRIIADDDIEFTLYAGVYDLDNEKGDFSTLGSVVNYAWDFLATVKNLTDPGSFGCEYLFNFGEM